MGYMGQEGAWNRGEEREREMLMFSDTFALAHAHVHTMGGRAWGTTAQQRP